MVRLGIASSLAAVFTIAASTEASARVVPLSEQPAVRHKVELRDGRVEITPTFEGSIGAHFRHTLSFGAKAEYHLTDTLSFGVMGFYGVGLDTGLMDLLVEKLPQERPMDNPTPSKADALSHANTVELHGGAGVTYTPWYGKMALFSKVFFSYDVYLSGGVAFARTKNTFGGPDRVTVCDRRCDDPDPTRHIFNDPRNDGPHNAGNNFGAQFGGGFHFYMGRWAALDISLRNYMFNDNPSGFDFDADLDVDEADRRFMSHLFVGVGLSIYMPFTPRISR